MRSTRQCGPRRIHELTTFSVPTVSTLQIWPWAWEDWRKFVHAVCVFWGCACLPAKVSGKQQFTSPEVHFFIWSFWCKISLTSTSSRMSFLHSCFALLTKPFPACWQSILLVLLLLFHLLWCMSRYVLSFSHFEATDVFNICFMLSGSPIPLWPTSCCCFLLLLQQLGKVRYSYTFIQLILVCFEYQEKIMWKFNIETTSIVCIYRYSPLAVWFSREMLEAR